MLGFTKDDNKINDIPRYVVWIVAFVCAMYGILMTYDTQILSSKPVALSVMSFGIAALLLSFNPNLSLLPQWIKTVILTINTYAITIYLFHNILIDCANKIGGYLNVFDIGNHIGMDNYCGYIGNAVCFSILVGLIYACTKTIGIVETHKWIER